MQSKNTKVGNVKEQRTAPAIMKRSILSLCAVTLLTACSHAPRQVSREANLAIWSDRPAFTRLFDNQDDYGLTSDIYDGVWAGDAVPSLPRVVQPSAEAKRWHAGEGTIELLPALPPQWAERGSISGVKARGGITVSLSWENGRVTRYRLTSPTPRPVRLLINGEERAVVTQRN